MATGVEKQHPPMSPKVAKALGFSVPEMLEVCTDENILNVRALPEKCVS